MRSMLCHSAPRVSCLSSSTAVGHLPGSRSTSGPAPAQTSSSFLERVRVRVPVRVRVRVKVRGRGRVRVRVIGSQSVGFFYTDFEALSSWPEPSPSPSPQMWVFGAISWAHGPSPAPAPAPKCGFLVFAALGLRIKFSPSFEMRDHKCEPSIQNKVCE